MANSPTALWSHSGPYGLPMASASEEPVDHPQKLLCRDCVTQGNFVPPIVIVMRNGSSYCTLHLVES